MSDESLKPQIGYLNTDLDLVCDFDPAQLASELEARGFTVIVTPGEDGLFYVLCEDPNDIEPEPNIKRLLDAVDALTDRARELWGRCSKREFNIGYDCGDEPWSFNQGISNDTLRRMAECGASFRITLYPYRPESESRVSVILDDGTKLTLPAGLPVDVVEQVRRDFSGDEVTQRLVELALATSNARVQRCIVFAARGHLAHFRFLCELASTDYRDVIQAAECDRFSNQWYDFNRPIGEAEIPAAD